ncbi:MAG: efflux RND transporter periplasmic adaptor subunit [Kiritimatiellia bacterium]
MRKRIRYCLTLAVSLAVAAAATTPCDNHDHDHGQKHDHADEQKHDHADEQKHDHAGEQKHEHAGGQKHDHAGGQKHEHDHAGGEEIHVSVAAQKLIGIRTERIVRRNVQETLVLHGRLERAPTALTVLAAPIGGRVSLKVRPLAAVAAGDVLFTVSSPELAARREEIDVLARRLANYTASGAKNAALAAELETKRRALAAAVGAAAARDGVVDVRAPRAGVVQTPAVADGTRVETGATVLTIVDPADLRFKARVAPSDIANLHTGLAVQAQGVNGTVQLPPDETDVVYVHFDKPLPGGRAGLPLAVACAPAPAAGETPCVPNEALVMMGVTPTIFVRAKGADDAFVALAVEPGARGRTWTELRNFAPDDLDVVVRGQYELKLALANRTGGGRKAGHFHADGVVHEGED